MLERIKFFLRINFLENTIIARNTYDVIATIKHIVAMNTKNKQQVLLACNDDYAYKRAYNSKITGDIKSQEHVTDLRIPNHERSKLDGNVLFFDSLTVARDNAEYMYEYYQAKNIPNIYYVIKEGSVDVKRLKAKGFNLLFFGTKQFEEKYKNLRLMYISHLGYHITNYKNLRYKNCSSYPKGKCVFIPHGLTRGDRGFTFDRYKLNYFMAATAEERDIVLNNTLLFDTQVYATGFPRTDVRVRVENKDLIVYAPTYQTENKNEIKFDWLFETEINDYLSTSGKKIKVLLHKYINERTPELVEKLEENGNLIVEKLPNYDLAIKEGSLLITDFSSVYADFLWENVPVIFFQQVEYHYADPEFKYEDISTVCNNSTDLLKLIKNPPQRMCKDEALAPIDRKNRERIFNIVEVGDYVT